MRFAYFAFLTIVSVNIASAQISTKTGAIYGHLTDQQDVPLPDVLVTLESTEITSQDTETGPQGNFRFINLPPGLYTARFSLSGFAEVIQEDIRVITGAQVELSVAMKSALKEEVRVKAHPNILDKTKFGNAFVYTQEYLDHVPNGRDPLFLLAMTPAVDSSRLNTGTGSVFRAAFFGRGDNRGNNVWTYDGLNHTEPADPGEPPTYYDFAAFEEIQITTGGNDVSTQTGGIAITLVTKQGGNRWLGEASLFRSKETRDYGFNAGGPLIKDKLFVWGGYRFLDDQTQEEVVIRESSQLEDINAKVSLIWNSLHSTQVGYFRGNKKVEDREIVGNSAPEVLVDTSSPPNRGIWNFEHIWVPNDQFLITGRYGFLGLGFALNANGGTDKPVIYLAEINRYENTFSTVDPITRNVHDINLDGNCFKENFLGANHDFRYGFEYKSSDIHTFSTYGNGILITDYYQTIPNGVLTSGYLVAQHPLNLKFSTRNQSIYFSDTVRKDRLTLSLGIRYDYQTGKNKPSEVPGVAGFEEFVGPFDYAGGEPRIGTHNFSPRLGLTYALTDDKTLLKANYARYYDAFNPQFVTHSNPAAIYNGAYFYYKNANNDRAITTDEIISGPFYFGGNSGGGFNLDAFAASRIYDSDLTNAWTSEWLVGIERAIATDLSLGATFIYRRYGNFLRILPFGVTTDDYIPGGVFTARTVLGDFNVPYFVLGYLHDGTAILTNIKDYEQSYRGLDIFVQKRMKNNLLFNAFLTIQRQAGHYNGGDSLAIQTERNAGFGATYPFDPTNANFLQDQPYSYAGFGGSQNPFSEWSLKLSAVYLWPWNISTGAFIRYQQGYPMVLFGIVPDNTLRAFYRVRQHLILVEPIGSRRYGNIFTVDFQFQKTFDFGRKGRFTGILTIFNLTNAQTIITRARFVNFPDLNDPLARLDARSYRFGLRYSF